jgi:hypothetical protein
MRAILIGVCLSMLACGRSDPPSPLILGGNAEENALGRRELTTEQNGALQKAITSSGQACAGVDRAYLNDLGVDGKSESWAVRCLEASYQVHITADGSEPSVYRCRDRAGSDIPCFRGYSRYGGYSGGDGARSSAPLNPDLGKLLEPMTAQGSTVDSGGPPQP